MVSESPDKKCINADNCKRLMKKSQKTKEMDIKSQNKEIESSRLLHVDLFHAKS